jgi:selenide,water dikinase
LSQALLAQVLRQIPTSKGARSGKADGAVLVGTDTFDDAGVYRLRSDCALVQTVDFFTPIVDDPFTYGQIAAVNSLSDVYAMGGRPITALNLLGVPTDKVDAATIAAILRGGASKVTEAGCALIGGHTIRNPEPVYGMAVTGLVHPKRILTNAAARPGDLLVLTKPLGTGIATTAIKRGLASSSLVARVIRSMKQLNRAGAELAEKSLVKAATDITGFGFIGHLANIVRASNLAAEISARDVPSFGNELFKLIDDDCVPGGTRANLQSADELVDWTDTPEPLRILLTDAQTSGGLLLCVPPKNLPAVLRILRSHRTPVAAVVGRMARRPAGRILVRA